jgi:hypothetical protein
MFFYKRGAQVIAWPYLFNSPMLHVPMFCYSLCIVIHVFHLSLASMFLCVLLLPYFSVLSCFVDVCFNVLCFTTSPCFVTPMLHCSMFVALCFTTPMLHAPSCFLVLISCFTILVLHYSLASLLLPCFATLVVCHSHVLLLFIVSLFLCDIAFVLRNFHVLLLVTLLLLCDVTPMFHYSRASSLFSALGTFLFLVASLCPCVSSLLCFTAHVFCYALCFVVPFPISVLPPFTFLSFWNFTQGVWGAKASTNIFQTWNLVQRVGILEL